MVQHMHGQPCSPAYVPSTGAGCPATLAWYPTVGDHDGWRGAGEERADEGADALLGHRALLTPRLKRVEIKPIGLSDETHRVVAGRHGNPADPHLRPGLPAARQRHGERATGVDAIDLKMEALATFRGCDAHTKGVVAAGRDVDIVGQPFAARHPAHVIAGGAVGTG